MSAYHGALNPLASLCLCQLCNESSPSHDSTPDVSRAPETPLCFKAPGHVDGPSQSDEGLNQSDDGDGPSGRVIHV